MGDSRFVVLEFVAGAEHGWGCLVDDRFLIPVRLQRAATSAPLLARMFGTPEWLEFGSLSGDGQSASQGQPAPAGPSPAGPPAADVFTLWAQVLAGELTEDAAISAAARLRTVADSTLKEAGVVAGAFEYGASWAQVADAASIDVAEAKRRWADVADPDTR